MSGKYRHELKFDLTYADYLVLRPRLQAVMHPDPHAGTDGTYRIRSIYFDNYQDKALAEKIGGVQKREKWRIRWYNDDLTFFSLEKKAKLGSLCKKFSSPLTYEQCRRILDGDTDWLLDGDDLQQEFCLRRRAQLLQARIAVSYLREPYVYAPGNVRITFDSDLRTSLYDRDFFHSDCAGVPAGENPSRILLEVKFDEYLPGDIQDLLQLGRVRPSAFSKYGASRRFG